MSETVDHRIIRSKRALAEIKLEICDDADVDIVAAATSSAISPLKVPKSEKGAKSEAIAQQKMAQAVLVPEHHHIPRPPRKLQCQPTSLPRFLYGIGPKVTSNSRVQ